jgi:protein-S-isoprenylcysteine O-methyltransferase Ste14
VARLAAAVAFAFFVHLWWRAGGIAAGPVWVTLASTPAAVAWDLALLALFFVAHSGFASQRWKRWTGLDREPGRRLYLCLTLPVTFAVWALFVPLARPLLWDARGGLDLPFALIRLLALAGLVWTVRSFSLVDFFGAAPRAAPPGGPARLSTAGAFLLCRHPLYFFMTLLAAAETFMPLGRALMAASLLVYIVIGSRLEEAKLASDFGPDYLRYRAQTPWLFPTPTSIARVFKRAA